MGKARAKTFSESWTLLVINWQFKFFYSISLHQNGREFDYEINMLCVCVWCACVCVCGVRVCVCMCVRVLARMLYRKVIFQSLDQLIDFHEIRCETYGGRANL